MTEVAEVVVVVVVAMTMAAEACRANQRLPAKRRTMLRIQLEAADCYRPRRWHAKSIHSLLTSPEKTKPNGNVELDPWIRLINMTIRILCYV